MPKKKQMRLKASIEDIYRNKHFVPPKEQNLETIFEEPRQSKDGAPILTSVKKYKRYLHFDPTQNKIQKRKRKAKKCFKKLKMNYTTRSSPENSKSDDVSLYILDALDDASNDSDMEESNKITSKSFLMADQSETIEADPTSSARDVSCSDLFGTSNNKCKSCQLQNQGKDLIITDYTSDEHTEIETTSTSCDDTQMSVNNDKIVESPRRSCCIS